MSQDPPEDAQTQPKQKTWHTGLCHCCCNCSDNSCKYCCYSLFCPWCAYGSLYAKVSNKSCCMPCCAIFCADMCLPALISGIIYGMCGNPLTGPPCGCCMRMNNRYVVGHSAGAYDDCSLKTALYMAPELIIIEWFCYCCSYAQQMTELEKTQGKGLGVASGGDFTGLLGVNSMRLAEMEPLAAASDDKDI